MHALVRPKIQQAESVDSYKPQNLCDTKVVTRPKFNKKLQRSLPYEICFPKHPKPGANVAQTFPSSQTPTR